MSEIKKSMLFDSKSVVVVLDTNQIYDNFFMDTPRFQLMLSSMETLNYKLIVPQIVFDEIIYKYKEKLENTFNAFNSQATELKKLVIEEKFSCPAEFDAIKHEKAYKDFLLVKIRKYGELMPYPAVSHEDLARKAMAKSKPFNNKGAGYRDALIWESVKSIANVEMKTVAFITNNSADFCKGKGDDSCMLHDQLLNEINTKENIVFFLNVEAFNEDFLAKHLVKISNLHDQLGNSIEKWLNANIYPVIKANQDWGHFSTGLPRGACRYFLQKCERISKPSIVEAYKIDEVKVFVKFKTNIRIYSLVGVDYCDFAFYRDIRDWVGFDFDILDCISVDHQHEIETYFDMIINTSNLCVESSELIGMKNENHHIEY